MNKSCHSAAVAILVRHPLPGQVKSRLAHDIGRENACDLYKAMVADALVNINSSCLPLFLFHDGLQQEGLPAYWLAAAKGVYRQEGETLGERMSGVFVRLFADGVQKAILVGSDIPGIDVPLLQSAVDALDSSEVVFSPAFDGGYCLVAFRKESYSNNIFHDIPWSTEHVLENTLDICRAENLKYALLDYRQDIDNLHDLLSYSRKLSPTALATNQWLLTNFQQKDNPEMAG